MAFLHIFRLVAFAVISVFSLIVLGLDAHLVDLAKGHGPTWTGFGVAVAVITLLVIGGIMITDVLRKGAITSLVWVELAWVGLVMILWLALAADMASNLVDVNCDRFFFSETESICHQWQAAHAFSWLNWLIFLAYFGLLLGFSIYAHTRGNTRIWFSPVHDSDFTGAGVPADHVGSPVVNDKNIEQSPSTYPPALAQPQAQYSSNV